MGDGEYVGEFYMFSFFFLSTSCIAPLHLAFTSFLTTICLYCTIIFFVALQQSRSAARAACSNSEFTAVSTPLMTTFLGRTRAKTTPGTCNSSIVCVVITRRIRWRLRKTLTNTPTTTTTTVVVWASTPTVRCALGGRRAI
jgi:hypothetical protein